MLASAVRHYPARRICPLSIRSYRFKHYEDLSGTIISLVDNGYALSGFIPHIYADASGRFHMPSMIYPYRTAIDRHRRFPVDLLRRYSKDFRERKISIQDTEAVDEWVREKTLHCEELERVMSMMCTRKVLKLNLI